MTRSALKPGQREIVEIIEALGFGVVERLVIRGGLPCFDPEPRVLQEIKLGSELGRQRDLGDANVTLKKDFENLFAQLGQLPDGVVDIEVRHGAPFRLVLERSYKGLL